MRSRLPFAGFVPLMLAVVLATGCAGREEESARKAIDEVTAAVDAAGPDAIKYVPRKVSTVRGEVIRLKVMYYDRDYAGILAAAPDVLKEAQNLTAAAASRKGEIAVSLENDWEALSTSTPAALAAARSRVAELQKAKTLPAGVTAQVLESAVKGIAEYESQWQKANEAKAAGDLEQAVTLASSARRRAQVLVRMLQGTQG
jgi:hypothetical protein